MVALTSSVNGDASRARTSGPIRSLDMDWMLFAACSELELKESDGGVSPEHCAPFLSTLLPNRRQEGGLHDLSNRNIQSLARATTLGS